jgi:putative ATPase
MDLFDAARKENAPLSERMRCKTLEEFIGQEHLLAKDGLLARAIRSNRLGNCIFYGPPGTGKTTLANVIAHTSGAAYEYLNAVSSGVSDAKRVIEDAKNRLALYGKRTYLFLDECHRWSKAQSDSVLSAMEKGEIIFIGSTTENPYVSMTRAIVSRCRLFEFRKLGQSDIEKGLIRALNDKERGLGQHKAVVEEKALKHIAFTANGDLRQALNALELAVLTTKPDKDGAVFIGLAEAEQSIQRRSMSVSEDLYYDMISAFCKSLRGSDPDAAVYYALRLIDAGCDPMLLARRLLVHSAEDVGLADPRALTVAANAMYALEKLGLPEGRIPLTEAVIYVCLAPKSNAVVRAIDLAGEAVKLGLDDVPNYLRDQSYLPNKDNSYKYPHDFGGYVEQQYLPKALQGQTYYIPSENGEEAKIKRKQAK